MRARCRRRRRRCDQCRRSYLLRAGDSARFDGRAGHYCTTEDIPVTTHSIVGYPLA
ncbi:hypothetical protein [Streptomyces sp. NPDC003247]|uniref:hypothetical protein n=1 Tax=Streptomyces sp. NPDC003247 TaxID=3364677 RepID=UPI0036CD8636